MCVSQLYSLAPCLTGKTRPKRQRGGSGNTGSCQQSQNLGGQGLYPCFSLTRRTNPTPDSWGNTQGNRCPRASMPAHTSSSPGL